MKMKMKRWKNMSDKGWYITVWLPLGLIEKLEEIRLRRIKRGYAGRDLSNSKIVRDLIIQALARGEDPWVFYVVCKEAEGERTPFYITKSEKDAINTAREHKPSKPTGDIVVYRIAAGRLAVKQEYRQKH